MFLWHRPMATGASAPTAVSTSPRTASPGVRSEVGAVAPQIGWAVGVLSAAAAAVAAEAAAEAEAAVETAPAAPRPWVRGGGGGGSEGSGSDGASSTSTAPPPPSSPMELMAALAVELVCEVGPQTILRRWRVS